jgi:L-threonylcarbamoyladenylate synthase
MGVLWQAALCLFILSAILYFALNNRGIKLEKYLKYSLNAFIAGSLKMTEIIKPGSSLEAYEKVKQLLLQGHLIGLPTETVYGLAGDATNNQAVATIYALKNRPSFNPLICHFARLEHLLEHCLPHPALAALAEQFWPGPLTIILKRRSSSLISPLVSAGLDSIAVRIPDHPVALEVIERVHKPLAAPSANPSEAISPTSPQHVLKGFKNNPRLPVILDGGPCRVGVESTVLDLTNPQPIILRPGGIPLEELRQVVGEVQSFTTFNNMLVRSPGMTKRHYAPSIPLRINAQNVQPGEALLAFGNNVPESGEIVLNLSPMGDLIEAAANLFKMLHELDQKIYTGIAVMPIPSQGIGVAINDRLQRAATPA